MMVLPLVLTIAVVAYALGWRPQFLQSGSAPTGQTPLEILKARYARGEITQEQFQEMRRAIDG
jgi:uncharacterized membrane protein